MSQRPSSITILQTFFRMRPGVLLFLLVFVFGGTVVGQPLSVETDVTSGTCGVNNGVLTVTVTGGTGPYTIWVSLGAYSKIGSTNPVTLSGLGPGIYTVYVKDANPADPVIYKYPEITNIAGPSGLVVGVQSEPTCLNNDGVVNLNIVGGTAPYTFYYEDAAVGTPTGTTGTVGNLPSGNVQLQVRDVNGCVFTQNTVIPLNDNLTLQMDNDTTICQGGSGPLGITSNGTSFNWTPPDGLSSVTAERPIAAPNESIAYTVTAGYGICTTEGTVIVTVLPAPVADAGAPDTICYGKAISLQGSGGVQYQWSPAQGLNNAFIADPVVTDPTSTITYSLTVVGANGCPSLTSSSMTLTVLPPYQVFAGNDTSVMVGQTVPLDAVDVQNVGFDQFAWSPPAGLSDPLIADPTASFTETGVYTYIVKATAPNGCAGSNSITIKVYALADIFLPNAFTPNGDGHNDLFRALPVSIREFNYLSVFNRVGQRVFTTNNVSIGWDGTFNGQELPAGTYVWMAGGIDYSGRAVERKGTVILIR